MARPIQFRVLTMLIVATLISIAVGIYFERNRPGDVSIRLNTGETIISPDDIISVDWIAQKFTLRNGLKAQLHQDLAPRGLVGGVPFHFCVDDDIIYTGRITTMLSSFGFDGLAIVVSPNSPADNAIVIQRGYPASATSRQKNDIRFRHRIYTSLWLAGKFGEIKRKVK